MNLPLSPDDGHAFLLVAGLGVIVGVMLGGWVMSVLHKLLLALLKMTLLGAVVIIGFALWSGHQAQHGKASTPADPTHTGPTTHPESNRDYRTPDKEPTRDRWWEQ